MDIGTIPCQSNEEQIFTGLGDCNKKESKTVDLIITKMRADYPADAETFNDNLESNVNAPDSSPEKMWIIKGVTLTDSTGGDVTTSDAGYGATIPVGYAGVVQTYRITNGGDCLAKQLAKLKNKSWRLFRHDDEDTLYGTAFLRQNDLRFRGYDVYMMITETPANGTDPYILNLVVYYSSNYEKERKDRHAIVVDNIPDGLNGIMLQKGATAGTARVVDICSGEDYTAVYGAQWEANMFVNASGANPTNVVYDADTNLLTFTPVASYKIASADILSAGNIIGFEGVNKLVNLTA